MDEEPFREMANLAVCSLFLAVPHVLFFAGMGYLTGHQTQLICDELVKDLLK